MHFETKSCCVHKEAASAELTVGLLPANISQMQFPRVAGRHDRVRQRASFLQGVFDLHHLLAPDQRVSAQV